MQFITALHTDIGIKKKTNQDSALILEAETANGNVLMACVCDGMGGLAKGEVASAALVKAFSKWFQIDFPKIFYSGCRSEDIRNGMEQVLLSMSKKIMSYGNSCGVSLGTTAVVLLLCGNKYYIINVGDSRAYMLTDNLYQLTKDQTFIQREMDMGRMTYEEAMVHPQRNVLLQCIGASDYVVPDFYEGEIWAGQEFLLCSDGFRHIITPQELFEALNPAVMNDSQSMRSALTNLTELNKSRREEDNISSLLIKLN